MHDSMIKMFAMLPASMMTPLEPFIREYQILWSSKTTHLQSGEYSRLIDLWHHQRFSAFYSISFGGYSTWTEIAASNILKLRRLLSST